MPSVQALKRKHKKLQEEYDLKCEELKRLRIANASEPDVTTQFKYEKRIEQIEQEQRQLEQELQQLEHQLEVTMNGVEGPPFQWDYSKFPIDFSAKIEFLTQYFVGRQEAIEKIAQFLQTHKSGYLAIVGEAGIGKSALLAKLVKERGYLHHFVDDKQNSAKDEVFLRSMVEQLRQKYGFEFEERPPIAVSEWNIYFQKWLKEASTEGQLTICVDALDEAQHYGGSDNLLKYLPHELPDNVYFILTSRPELKKEDITLFVSTVFETYSLSPLTLSDIENYLIQCNIATASEVATVIWQKSEGNPLYLYYLLQECDGQNLKLEQVNQLPQGLMKFYEKQWHERIWVGDKATKEGYKQILCLLLILKEPPSEEILLELTDLDWAELHDYLNSLRHFMRIGERYEFFHDSFKNFVQCQFDKTVLKYQEKVIECLYNWRELTGKLFDYTLAWLPTHLQEGGRMDEVRNLLLDLNFWEERVHKYSIDDVLYDFALLHEKDTKLYLLQMTLQRYNYFDTPVNEYFLQQIYSRSAEFYPKHKKEFLTSNFQEAFTKSRLLPAIWLKRKNNCLERGSFGHSRSVNSVAFSSNGMKVVSGSEDRTIKIWETATGDELNTFNGDSWAVFSVAFSPDGKYIVSGSRDVAIRLWNIITGEILKTFIGHSCSVISVAFSPDGKQIISGSSDAMIKLWDVITGKEIKTFRGHSNPVTSVAFSFDGTQIISASTDETVKLWDVATGKELKIFRWSSAWLKSAALSHDTKQIASCSEYERTIKLWDVATGKELITLAGHDREISSIAFSPDDSKLASGSFDKTIQLWNIATGNSLLKFYADAPILCVSFSPDGSEIWAADNYQAPRIYRFEIVQHNKQKKTSL
jgi:WD40 repeat protein